MPPKGFQKPKLSGTVTLKRFDPPQEEVSAAIKKGELVKPLQELAQQVGLVEDEANPLCIVDEQQLILSCKLFDGHVYYLSGGKAAGGGGGADFSACLPDAAVAYVYHPDMLKHDPHGHRSPETSHRLQRGIDMLRQCDQSADLIPPEMCNDDALSNTSKKSAHNLSHFIPPRLATKEEVYTFHDKAVYEDFLEKGTVLENLKSDVYCNEGTSSRAVKLSVGGIIDASHLILQNVTRTTPAKEPSDSIFSSFCLLRPPGHHCTANRPSGFCLVNNVCLAAENLMRKCTVPEGSTTRPPRIAILDLDVHFGEGIAEYVDHFQSSSGECPLLYLSIHRYDDGGFYPFEKTADATFTGAGNKGSIGNMAIDTHASDVEKCEQVISDFLLEKLIDKVVLPRLDRFKPDLLFVSMGFDAAYGDPLGKMAVESGFCRSVSALKRWCTSGNSSKPPVGLVVALEGGYSPEAVALGILHVSYALTYAPDSALVKHFSEPKVPRTWGELRLKQERKYAQWEKSEQLASEKPPQLTVDDTTLLKKHVEWCDAQVKKFSSLVA